MIKRAIMTDRKEYMKAYRERHKEEIKKYNKNYFKDYYLSHKDEIVDRASNYNKNNKDKHRESSRKYARKSYIETKNKISTEMYLFDNNVTIVDEKHINYKGLTYCIVKNGYLSHREKLLHIEIAKDLGIWFNGCEIHHINGSTLDNRKSNLIALLPDEHEHAHSLLKENKELYYNWIEQKKVG